ncbi:ketopantoate reductase family protein [Candidatus Latescibacterota bacterium]
MRILIFGAGAVGQAAGCMLAADGNSVDLIVRERFREKIQSDGLSVTGIFGDFHADPGNPGVYTSVENLSDKVFDYALITTKSYDTETAAIELLKLRDQSFKVVSMQNGCGNLEIVEKHFGKDRTLGARVITGFEIENPGIIKITVTADDIHIGDYDEGGISKSAADFAETLNRAGLPCVTTRYIYRDLLAKLLYNCALNPLGAILGVHYGALGDDPQARDIMNRIIDEVFAVIDSMGVKTHWDNADEYRSYFYSKQVPATYNHRPSMLQDLENGKQTEVDALTGYVSNQGKLFDIPTPICDMLSAMVHFSERNSRRKNEI